MALDRSRLSRQVEELHVRISSLIPETRSDLKSAAQTWRSHADALSFHLLPPEKFFPIAVLGGTGTGKSTLVNRLVESRVCATSFQRTFTRGAVAITALASAIPQTWPGLPHMVKSGAELPASGSEDVLEIVEVEQEILKFLTLIDTPDLDGDEPVHHERADQIFRWSRGVMFVVTPEKYQMTELLPYYRLALRYGLPAAFVMNKAEDDPTVHDYAQLLSGNEWPEAKIFVIPRDDSSFEPKKEERLEAMRSWLRRVPETSGGEDQGVKQRTRDLVQRIEDQIFAPLRNDLSEIARLRNTLRGLYAPPAGIDVSPLTERLMKRLQERSVLYLMGPERVMDRIKQIPNVFIHFPRTAGDWLRGGAHGGSKAPESEKLPPETPQFIRRALMDEFSLLQTRIADLVVSGSGAGPWKNGGGIKESEIELEQAGRIADEEIENLRKWLEERWDSKPRDTRAIHAIFKYLPGGEKIVELLEVAPYLLIAASMASNFVAPGVELIVIGGYTLTTWIAEKLSNEVTARTRETNIRIARRFQELTRQQVQRTICWLEMQAPPPEKLREAETLAAKIWELAQ